MKLVKCKSCGQSIAKSAKTCPNCGAKRKKRTLLWILVAVFLIIGIIATANGGGSEPENSGTTDADAVTSTQKAETEDETKAESEKKDTTVTLSEFEAVETGMTYEEVVAIIGFDGELNSQVDIGAGEAYKTEIYTWANLFGSNMNVTFQGGKVIAKAQFGLS